MLAVDHVVVLVSDLGDAATRMLEEHGLASIAGGRHAGHGTGNRIVPLGDAYVELMAVVAPDEARSSPMGRWALAGTGPGPTPAALCLRTDDADAVAARLGIEPLAMSRVRPDGSVLSWRLVGLDEMMTRGLPFFIEWEGAPADHPGWADAEHRVSPTGRLHVTLSGDPAELDAWLGGHGRALEIVDGPPGVARVAIETAGGRVLL